MTCAHAYIVPVRCRSSEELDAVNTIFFSSPVVESRQRKQRRAHLNWMRLIVIHVCSINMTICLGSQSEEDGDAALSRAPRKNERVTTPNKTEKSMLRVSRFFRSCCIAVCVRIDLCVALAIHCSFASRPVCNEMRFLCLIGLNWTTSLTWHNRCNVCPLACYFWWAVVRW